MLIIPLMLISSCSDDPGLVEPVVEGSEISKFYFSSEKNPKLFRDTYAIIEDKYD